MRTSILRTAAACAALLIGLSAAIAQTVPLPQPRPAIVTLDSAERCIAAVVYTEARGESDEGQHTVAYVAYMRALLDLPGYGGPTPCGVALANKQFDGIRGTAFVPKEPLAWQKALIVAHMVLTKRFVPEGELRFATYYLAPKDASKTGWCWFKRNLIPIGWVGQHLFYREPLRYERGMLATHCPEYAARMVASR